MLLQQQQKISCSVDFWIFSSFENFRIRANGMPLCSFFLTALLLLQFNAKYIIKHISEYAVVINKWRYNLNGNSWNLNFLATKKSYIKLCKCKKPNKMQGNICTSIQSENIICWQHNWQVWVWNPDCCEINKRLIK